MEKFGYKKDQVDILRTAHKWYPEEPLFKDIPIHVKFNRARVGHLTEGSRINNLSLFNLNNGEEEMLVKYESSAWWPIGNGLLKKMNGMTVVMAGSYS